MKGLRHTGSKCLPCKRVAEEYAQHLGDVFRDREVDKRLCVKAAICFGTARGICSQEDSLLSITIDGMDAAKFRCPRNISAAKEFQNLWRPEMTLIGAILEGVQETYYLAEPDTSKSADLHCSIIGNQLEIARAAFEARGKPFPRHLRLHTDNAAAEGKNQTVAYLGYLVHRGLFDSVVLTQFRVGHTHAKIDQRFSEVRGVLGQCTVLEEPGAFVAAIRAGVQPREGRALGAQRILSTLNFKAFFSSLELKMSGHTQTRWQKLRNEEAIHVFQIERRESFSGQSNVQELPGVEPAMSDLIMSCRQHLSSTDPSQPPFVFAKAEEFDVLRTTGPGELAARSAFSQRQLKEFQKTAAAIAASPWDMQQGCAYLLKLCEDNVSNTSDSWRPPVMEWMLRGSRSTDLAPSEPPGQLPPTALAWNRPKPAVVEVSRPPVKLRRLQVKQPILQAAPAAEAVAEDLPSPAEVEHSPQELPISAPAAAPAMMGAPDRLHGAQGAPPRVAPEPPPVDPVREAAAKPKAKCGPKAAAKGKAKAKAAPDPKAKPKAGAGSRGPYKGLLPMPLGAGEKVGCTRCRYSQVGCRGCRQKAGLILNEDGTAWVWAPGFGN